ncbi:hypothetical protein Ait01nite_004390 [Actinoplanes italicus]|uniref:Uncharacterized protein n=1 Tax=Actinoplanes italicus TaxID=113567 RepID=A0A2T0KN27_9ACTN|nr:hypothetical protein [Actinoplanes italicus]PRX24877.1 hypothetical protein CLV67_102657 [Actinoplanes italicus]GIE27394.1 hypothetical protein Ait01nite_004390 [Actinoplanes italicus]
MRFRLYAHPAPVILAGRSVPAPDGLHVEAAGGFRLRCTATAAMFEPLPGSVLRVRSADGVPLPGSDRPVTGFTIANETGADLAIWLETAGFHFVLPAGATVPAACVTPRPDGAGTWDGVGEIVSEPGLLQFFELADVSFVLGMPDGSVLEAYHPADPLIAAMLRELGYEARSRKHGGAEGRPEHVCVEGRFVSAG